jgi:sarcosine oxidase subunit beta
MPSQTADAVVIGAGVIGASIAYHLTRLGIRPLVIEAQDPAAGSSGACDGLVFLQSKKPGLHLKIALASRSRFDTLRETLGPGIEFRATGGMCLVETEAELAAVQRFVAEQRASGLQVELLGGEEARRREPELSARVIAATWSAADAQVNPYGLTFAFLRAARAGGAQVLTGRAAVGIRVDRGRVEAVHLAGGSVSTRVVINAAGARAAEVGRWLGLEIPITPRRGQILVTAVVPPLIRHCLISAQYVAAKFDPELAKRGMGFSVEQTDNGNLLIGSTREFVGFDRRTTLEGLHTIAARIAPILPALKRVPVIRAFAGLRPYTPDGLPILGPVPDVDGFVVAAGHEGDGIALSAVTGELIADGVAGRPTAFPMAEFSLERFRRAA